jgi:hypothetical protein
VTVAPFYRGLKEGKRHHRVPWKQHSDPHERKVAVIFERVSGLSAGRHGQALVTQIFGESHIFGALQEIFTGAGVRPLQGRPAHVESLGEVAEGLRAPRAPSYK